METQSQPVVYCPSCKWEGHDTECRSENFGAYCGGKNDPPETWGWEEWNDLVCPECGTVVEFNDFDYECD